MKNKFNVLKISALMLISVFAFSSCSKNDDDNGKIEKEAKIRVEIEHTGDFEHYGSGLSASSSLTRDLKMVNLNGVEWDDLETNNNVTVYAKDYEILPKVISFETVAAGTFIQFGYMAWVSSNEDGVVNPLKVTIKYYLDGKLVKSENYNPLVKDGVPANYLGRLEVKDY